MNVTARLHYLHIAPRKVRLVAGLVKGLPAPVALAQLKHLPKRASAPMEKLLRSAVANAKHNFSLDEKNLRVKNVIVDSGPVLKRMVPRAFGRGAMIRKRMSHVTLLLDEMTPSTEREAKKRAASAPEVRKATLEDLREIEREEEVREAREIASEKKGSKASDPGLVKRIFNRKAV